MSRTHCRNPYPAIAIITTLLLAACGGGSGSSPTANPSDPRSQLRLIDQRIATSAYPQGLNTPRGTGQTIAIWDHRTSHASSVQHAAATIAPSATFTTEIQRGLSIRTLPFQQIADQGADIILYGAAGATAPEEFYVSVAEHISRYPDIAFVFGAGNDGHGRHAPARSSEHSARGNPHAVVVTDINPQTRRPHTYIDGRIPHPCGSDAHRAQHSYTCLAAATGWHPARPTEVGTSLASAYTAGAIALLEQFFPHQRPSQHIKRLCETASLDNLTSFEAGCGLIDFAAATRPVGSTSIATSASPTSAVPASGTAAMTSSALGFTGPDILVLDSLDYPFSVPFAVLTPQRPDDLSNLLDTWTRPPVAPRRLLTPLAFADSFTHTPLPHSSANILLTAFHDTNTTGVSIATPLLTAGFISEPDSALGLQTSGAFGQVSASTLYAGLYREASIGQWAVSAHAEIAWTRTAVQPSLLRSLSPIISSTARIAATRRFQAHTFGIALAQPLRAEHGTATFFLPTGMAGPDTIMHETVHSDVTPPRRNLQLGVTWSPSHLRYGHLQAAWVHQTAPAHRPAPSDNAFLANYTLNW